MHFSTKSYLKSNRNHTAKQTLSQFDTEIRVFILERYLKIFFYKIINSMFFLKLHYIFLYKDIRIIRKKTFNES
jgi:hypothetical protein